MSERCPLESGLYWDNSARSPIPDICTEKCGDAMETALLGVAHVDMFDITCAHNLEHGGQSLQRGKASERFIGILNVCEKTGNDVFADEYSFDCPFN